MKQQLTKNFLRTAGTGLKNYLDDAFRLGGNVGQQAATSALRAGKAEFFPQLVGKTGKAVPMLLREGPKQAIPTAGRLLGQGTVFGTGLGLGLAWLLITIQNFYSFVYVPGTSIPYPVSLTASNKSFVMSKP